MGSCEEVDGATRAVALAPHFGVPELSAIESPVAVARQPARMFTALPAIPVRVMTEIVD